MPVIPASRISWALENIAPIDTVERCEYFDGLKRALPIRELDIGTICVLRVAHNYSYSSPNCYASDYRVKLVDHDPAQRSGRPLMTKLAKLAFTAVNANDQPISKPFTYPADQSGVLRSRRRLLINTLNFDRGYIQINRDDLDEEWLNLPDARSNMALSWPTGVLTKH